MNSNRTSKILFNLSIGIVVVCIFLATLTYILKSNDAVGYYFIAPDDGGYEVKTSSTTTVISVSKPLPLADAMTLCDKLNKDLGANARDSQ